MKSKSKIKIYYKSHHSIQFEGFESIAFDFIKQRLSYFLSGHDLKFIGFSDEVVLKKDFENSEDERDMIVATTLLNPLLDEKLLSRMMTLAIEKDAVIIPSGEVPGTAPLFVSTMGALKNDRTNYICFSDMQGRYNSQMNMARLKRVKVFKSFIKNDSSLYKMDLEKILDFCGTREGVNFILSYDSQVNLRCINQCPLCGSSERHALHSDTGQPVTGFLTKHSEYYQLCELCGLVYLDPQMPENELWRYYDVYSYERGIDTSLLEDHYRNINSENTSAFYNYQSSLPYLWKLPRNADIIDLGGGLGEYAVYVRERFPTFKITINDFMLDAAVISKLMKMDIIAIQTNFLNEPISEDKYDLITNWEVIEHLPVEKITSYFIKLHSALKKNGIYILSTPDYADPYCKALDFWAAYPGEHLSVFSRKVLEPVLNKCGFEVIGEHHESVTMKSAGRWFKYGAHSHSNMSSRSESFIIDDMLKDESILSSHQKNMRKNNLGSEMIICAQKR